MIDADPNPGVVCMCRGCIPSRALFHAARVLVNKMKRKIIDQSAVNYSPGGSCDYYLNEARGNVPEYRNESALLGLGSVATGRYSFEEAPAIQGGFNGARGGLAEAADGGVAHGLSHFA